MARDRPPSRRSPFTIASRALGFSRSFRGCRDAPDGVTSHDHVCEHESGGDGRKRVPRPRLRSRSRRRVAIDAVPSCRDQPRDPVAGCELVVARKPGDHAPRNPHDILLVTHGQASEWLGVRLPRGSHPAGSSGSVRPRAWLAIGIDSVATTPTHAAGVVVTLPSDHEPLESAS